MAAKLEFVFRTAAWLDVPELKSKYELAVDDRISIDGVSILDDWSWAVVRPERNVCAIETAVKEGKIAHLSMNSSLFGEIGTYIEKTIHGFLYEVWMDTTEWVELDVDYVTEDNTSVYMRISQKICEVFSEFADTESWVAIGVETDVEEKSSVFDTIKSAKNVVGWILRDSLVMSMFQTEYPLQKLQSHWGMMFKVSLKP